MKRSKNQKWQIGIVALAFVSAMVWSAVQNAPSCSEQPGNRPIPIEAANESSGSGG